MVAKTWWGKALSVFPIRIRAAILLPVISSLFFVPFLIACWECFWNCGFSEFSIEIQGCYSPWWKAVKAIWAALITGEQQ